MLADASDRGGRFGRKACIHIDHGEYRNLVDKAYTCMEAPSRELTMHGTQSSMRLAQI